MSLDFDLLEHPCAHCNRGDEVFTANITHNLVRMWQAAGVSEALYESEGKTAAEVVDALRRGLVELEARPAFFETFQSKNGWGLYKHAVPWLRTVVRACERYPSAIIRVSR